MKMSRGGEEARRRFWKGPRDQSAAPNTIKEIAARCFASSLLSLSLSFFLLFIIIIIIIIICFSFSFIAIGFVGSTAQTD